MKQETQRKAQRKVLQSSPLRVLSEAFGDVSTIRDIGSCQIHYTMKGRAHEFI